jgi:hypothetical protein
MRLNLWREVLRIGMKNHRVPTARLCLVVFVTLLAIQPAFPLRILADSVHTDSPDHNQVIESIDRYINGVSKPAPQSTPEVSDIPTPPVGIDPRISIDQYPFMGPLLGIVLILVVVSLILINRIRRRWGAD